MVQGFRCGELELDQWIELHAQAADRARTASTFVWLKDGHHEVVAYYTLTAHAVRKPEMPSRIGRGMPDLIPAALIGKLALHTDLQGRGLGRALLMDALSRIIKVSRQGPAIRAVVVDSSTPAATRLYSSMGFQEVDGAPGRMVVRAGAVEQSLILAGFLPSN